VFLCVFSWPPARVWKLRSLCRVESPFLDWILVRGTPGALLELVSLVGRGQLLEADAELAVQNYP
jgi:hypothetical protein